MSDKETLLGTVVSYGRRGFGWIWSDTHQRVYVHISQVIGRPALHEGERVRFELIRTKRSPEAYHVEVLSADNVEVGNDVSEHN